MNGSRFGIVILSFLFIISLGMAIFTITRPPEKTVESRSHASKSFTTLLEDVVGSSEKDGLAVVKVYGPIFTSTDNSIFQFESPGADRIARKIRRFGKNRHCKALVLRVNSPGGSIGASQEILNAIKEVKGKHNIPVIVSMGDIAASGGYFISTAADKIVANPGTLTGSIGVYIRNINWTDFVKKHGIKLNIIKSGKYKDILSAWRKMGNDERILLEKVVDDCYQQFLEVVASGRNIPLNTLKKVADGRIMTGRQAKEVNLVDELGTYEDAIKMAWKMTGLKGTPHIIKDTREKLDFIFDILEMKKTNQPKSLTEFAFGIKNPSYVPITYMYPGLGF